MKIGFRSLIFSSAMLASIVTAMSTANAELIANGGFETGNFNGWVTNPASFPQSIVNNPVQSGFNAAQIAGFQANPNTLSQTVSTTLGTDYVLSFWVWQDTGTPNGFSVAWDGNSLYSETDYTDAPGYRYFAFNVVGSGSDTLIFTAYNDPAFTYVDDVSLIGGVVPEPSTLALAGVGGLGLAIRAIRRRRAAAA